MMAIAIAIVIAIEGNEQICYLNAIEGREIYLEFAVLTDAIEGREMNKLMLLLTNIRSKLQIST